MKRANVEKLVNEKIAAIDTDPHELQVRIAFLESRLDKLIQVLSDKDPSNVELAHMAPIPF